MKTKLAHGLNTYLQKKFPERRIFLRSDSETRFVRLSPAAQLVAVTGGTALIAWTTIATAVLLMDFIGSGSVRDQARREQASYETRLNLLSGERDRRAEEAAAAQDRFNVALAEISQMQSALLASEDRRSELETGIDVIQSTLRRTMNERDAAREQVATYKSELAGETGTTRTAAARTGDIETTVDFLTAALEETAGERDRIATAATDAEKRIDDLLLDARLVQERNDRIFQQLEEAVAVSIEPLNKMFSEAGLPPERIIDTVRQGYSGQGGPLTPLSFSTRGEPAHADSLRANGILSRMDEVNLYRIAAQKLPFDMPVKAAFRFTSGFGPRWGRAHEGLDLAGAHATPIHATGDGVVVHAGWLSGYGRLVKIRHEFGIETRYAHMSALNVKEGQRVSRGDRIGDMGNSGRSTGTHLHYEIRVDGKPVNPMTYIRAARNVF